MKKKKKTLQTRKRDIKGEKKFKSFLEVAIQSNPNRFELSKKKES